MLYIKIIIDDIVAPPPNYKELIFDVFVEFCQYNDIVLLLLEDNFLESNTGN